MNFLIRTAKIEDSNAISLLTSQLGYPSIVEEIQIRLQAILSHNDHCVFVATDNDDMIIGWIHGFFSLRVESDSFIEIGGLVIDQDYRKKGIGKMLVKKVEEWGKIKNCYKLRVRTNTLRTETHKFYVNIGFVLNKEQKIFDKFMD